jgi:hypothetical protein
MWRSAKNIAKLGYTSFDLSMDCGRAANLDPPRGAISEFDSAFKWSKSMELLLDGNN